MNLGQKVNYGMEVSMEKEKEVYPTLYIRSKEEIKIPDGRFKFSGEGKVIERVEKDRDGEECYCYEIEVYDMTPTGKVADSEEEDDLGMESMAEAFNRAAKKKMKDKTLAIEVEDEEYED